MLSYLIEGVNTCKQAAVVQDIVDFAWDLEVFRVAPYNGGLLVDLHGPLLHSSLGRMERWLGKHIQMVAGEQRDVDWQVIRTYASPED